MASNATLKSTDDLQSLKPYPDFPLTAHRNGQWVKKIRGVRRSFGPLSDPDAALQRYLDERDEWAVGRNPRDRQPAEGLTVKRLANLFLANAENRIASKELTQKRWNSYKLTFGRLLDAIDGSLEVEKLMPADFAAVKASLVKFSSNPNTLGSEIARVRRLFNWAQGAGLIDRGVRFGDQFGKPEKAVFRRHKAGQVPKLFTAADLRSMLAIPDVMFRAFLRLGINCAYTNVDCGELPVRVVDLKEGWISWPRPKTGIARECKLWPETVEAVAAAMEKTPEPAKEEFAGLAFLTQDGHRWSDNSILARRYRVLAKRHGFYRQGVTFGALRHTFETVAGGTRDQVAVDRIMGHADTSMAAEYREWLDPERIVAVTEHVRDWVQGG